jgi:DNA-binding transcriptional regulator YdaS (Cro superfamily)
MDLKAYMFEHRITCRTMANQLNIHEMYLSSIKNKKRKPSIDLAEKIEILTGGEVTVKEIRKM